MVLLLVDGGQSCQVLRANFLDHLLEFGQAGDHRHGGIVCDPGRDPSLEIDLGNVPNVAAPLLGTVYQVLTKVRNSAEVEGGGGRVLFSSGRDSWLYDPAAYV